MLMPGKRDPPLLANSKVRAPGEFGIISLQNVAIVSEKLDRPCVIGNDPRIEIAVNTVDRESREQADIPGVITVKTLIDAPDIQQLFCEFILKAPEGMNSRLILQAGQRFAMR